MVYLSLLNSFLISKTQANSDDGALPNAQVDHHMLVGTLDCRASAVHAALSRDRPAVKIPWTSLSSPLWHLRMENTYGNEFKYFEYLFSYFLLVFIFLGWISIFRMEMNWIRIKTDINISDIHFRVQLSFPFLGCVQIRKLCEK